MSGFLGHLSPQQEEALRQFHIVVQDIPKKPEESDHYYLRWLRARRFDVDKAEIMFRNHMDYRKKYGSDTILHWQPSEVMNECLAGGFFGEDRDGHPVWYDNIGNLDPRGLHRSVSLEDVLKLKCMHSELLSRTCREFSEKKGKLIENITLVVDFENLTFQKHNYWPAIEMFKTVLATEEANNPERTRRILLMKTPSIFPLCYNIVKHVLDEQTRKKIVVLGMSQSNWQEEVQKYISPDQLPAMYGGSRYEPDAECSNYISPGRDVPQKYYLTNQTEASREDMERVVVGRGSSHTVPYEVTEVGSTVQWEFFSTGYDISFEFHVKKRVSEKTEKEVIRPLSRTASHVIPQSGYHCCHIPGSYVLKFDNSYSWTRSKEVFYAVKVLPPNVSPDVHADLSSLVDEEKNGDEFFECNDELREQGNGQESSA